MLLLIKKLISFFIKMVFKNLKFEIINKLFAFMGREIRNAIMKGEFIKLGLAGLFLLGAFLVLFIL